MAGQRPLNISPWSTEDNNTQDVASMLLQIIQQKGDFLSVTEESLEEEIRNGESQNDQSPSGKDEDDTPKAEDMQAIRTEINKLAAQAFDGSAQALDLISLVLTQYTTSAESSVSPFIKQAIPLKTLAVEPVAVPVVSEAKKQHDQLVSTGWKLQALNSAADLLLKSATKLEDEMKKEVVYWNQTLAVKKKGWTIARMPRDRHTLGVRFGFLESPPDFRDKSMAALKRDDSGSLNLDLGADFPGGKILRARVVRGNETIATYGYDPDKMEDDSVETAILQARNSIFDAELFSELLRESRELAPRGVQWSHSRITIPIDTDVSLLLELAAHGSSSHNISASGTKYDVLPGLALITLRILLGYSHTQHYKQRTESAPLIGDTSRTRTSPKLLRPLVSLVHHLRAQDHIALQLAEFRDMLHAAGFDTTVSAPQPKTDLARMLNSKMIKESQVFINTLLNSLIDEPETIITFQLSLISSPDIQPKPQICEVSISIRTHPKGSAYKLLLNGDGHLEGFKALYQEMTFIDSTKTMNELIYVIRGFIVRQLAALMKDKLKITGHGYPRLYADAPGETIHEITLELSLDRAQLLWPGIGKEQAGGITRLWTASTPVQNPTQEDLDDDEVLQSGVFPIPVHLQRIADAPGITRDLDHRSELYEGVPTIAAQQGVTANLTQAASPGLENENLSWDQASVNAAHITDSTRDDAALEEYTEDDMLKWLDGLFWPQ